MATTPQVSFAQSNEDVVLYAMLKDIPHGTYIDVGAQDATIDSVTKLFYDNGWSGINIEPVSHWYTRLCADRPRDINLQVAASSTTGKIRLFEIEETGLSSVVREFAQRAATERGLPVREYDVPAQTLDAICAEHKVREVHFLKIDAEGHEAEVLQGLSFSKVRPWIVVVEAVEPNSRIPNFDRWEHYLTDRDYECVHWDGLNRFYLAKEHAKLKAALDPPPNAAAMNFVRSAEVRLWQLAEARLQEINRVKIEYEASKQELDLRKREFEQEHETYAKSLAPLYEQLLQAEGKNHSLIREVERVVRALEAVKQELNQIKNEHEAAKRELDLAKRELDSAHDWLESRKRGIEWLNNEWELAKREIQSLHNELTSRERGIEWLNNELQSLHNALAASELRLHSTKQELTMAEQQLGVYAAERATFGAQIGRWLTRQHNRIAPAGTARGKLVTLAIAAVRVARREGLARAVWKSLTYPARRISRR